MKIVKIGRFAASARAWRAVRAAEKLGGRLTVTQASFNPGAVAASGGTHDEDGVFDFSTRGLTRGQALRRVRALRTVGFAAWLRTADEGPWSEHIHAVLIDCDRLAPLAAHQVRAYRAGRSGLRSNRRDRHAWMGLPVVTFAQYEASLDDDVQHPVLREGDRGPAVRVIQRALGVHVDGVFGPQTARAVNAFKRSHGLPDDAVAGGRFWRALLKEEAA